MTDDIPPTNRAYRCRTCAAHWYYTRPACPECRSADHETYELGVGTLLAETTARVTPDDVRAPNRLGLVDFDGVRVLAQVEDGATVGDDVSFAGDHALRGTGTTAVVGPRLVGVHQSGGGIKEPSD